MKKIILLVSFVISFVLASAQPGLIGHWTFDGNANDVSGNGLNGIISNVVPDTGYWGSPNTAYRFNGTNSSIGIPYKPIMNVNRFSIVALVQIRGYYSGTCQAEHIVKRGPESGSGQYGLLMFDNALDGNDCGAFDTTKFTFAGIGPAVPPTTWQYSPTIKSHKWYRAVITFDSTNYTLYINGQLILTCQTTAGPIGSSTDSLVIGRNYDNLTNYPYWFNGLIDDIKLFNRALTTAEVSLLEGVDDVNQIAEISFSPNPTKDIVNVHLPTNIKSNATITLTDAVGRIINTYPISKDQKETTLNIGTLSTGLYLLHYQDETTNQVLKLMKE